MLTVSKLSVCECLQYRHQHHYQAICSEGVHRAQRKSVVRTNLQCKCPWFCHLYIEVPLNQYYEHLYSQVYRPVSGNKMDTDMLLSEMEENI